MDRYVFVDWLVVDRFPGAGSEREGRGTWPRRKAKEWVRQEEGEEEGEKEREDIALIPSSEQRKRERGLSTTCWDKLNLQFIHGTNKHTQH